tara:strand:- start:13495 stop:17295 length:3801 start_codon:yes stop_codon:yes gene_type:complete
MAKDVLNIVDFSGGINKAVDKRDLEQNQIVSSDGLISYRPGKLTLDGAFNTIPGLNENVGSFSSQYISEGIPNLYAVFPEFGFRIFGKATCSGVSGSTGTFNVEPASSYHSLDVGAKLTVVKTSNDDELLGKHLIVTEIVSNTSFKAEDSTDVTVSGTIYYALNADYDSTSSLNCLPSNSYKNNKFFLKAAQYGKFGFYNIGDFRYWYGNSDSGYTNFFSNDSWFFDTQYLWDWKQDRGGNGGGFSINDIKVLDAYYDNGCFRLLLDAPKKFEKGHCKRPVGLYAISSNKYYFNKDSAEEKVVINKGWYPLRSHCLSPEEYHHKTEFINDESDNPHNYNGAGFIATDSTDATLSEFDSLVPDPIGASYNNSSLIVNQISVGIGTGNNAKPGDWQFASNEIDSTIGLGVSFLYDNIDNPLESSISKLVVNTTLADTVPIASGQNDKALYLYFKLYTGANTLTANQNEFLSGIEDGKHSVSEFRGSDMNNGFSNFGAWNPRIVGANIWLMHNNEGPIEDPLYLATVNFDYNSKTKSFSHDGIEASDNWQTATQAGVVHQLIPGIPSLPVLSYSLKNGYKYTDNIHAWYKTSAIVNRRLYAGNVSYYSKPINDILRNESPINYPDRILRSPVNKFDILPESSFLDIMNNDGQDIVKLVNFNQKLLVYKQDDLYVIDCSGEFEYLETTHKGVGISSATAVCSTPNAIYWLNSQGVYAMDAENPPVNIIKSRLGTSEWMQKIYNTFSHIEYEPQDNLLIIFSRYKDLVSDVSTDKHALIINIATGGLYFKSNPSVIIGSQYSKGVIANNKLYVSINGEGGDSEMFHSQNSTQFVAGSKAESTVSFKINNTSHNQSLGGTNNKYLMIYKGSSWVKINNLAFVETVNYTFSDVAATTLVQLYNEKCNTLNTNNSDYTHALNFTMESDGLTVKEYTATVKAKNTGTAYSMGSTSVTGYGSTNYAFSNDGTDGNLGIGDLTNFSVINNTAGVNAQAGVFQIFANRGERTNPGTEYTLQIQYGVNVGNDAFESRIIKANYITSSNPSELYNAATSSNYSNDSDPSANNLTNSNALITNIHEFLQNNFIESQGNEMSDLTDHFTFSSLNTDSDGSVTGVTNLKYFTMTMKTSSPFIDYSDTFITAYATGGKGGSILRWESDTKNNHNNIILETKDYDFTQPNVRKKVYKAYITYKADSNIKVYYQANQSGTFVLADVKDSVTDNTLLHSTEYTRGEITFGSGGNNIYSFSLKFVSTNECKIFDINDISFIYRIKRAK